MLNDLTMRATVFAFANMVSMAVLADSPNRVDTPAGDLSLALPAVTEPDPATTTTRAATPDAPRPTQASADASEPLESVVVTGTLLKKRVGDVALPVRTVDAAELSRSGATNAEQMIALVTENQSTTISNTSVGAGTGFASYASLRSLGGARTLVLLNGKRIVNDPYQALGVNLNTIPMALIDHVDVMGDGGSATYGTDAIAGVINFVTRRELSGLSVSATTTQPEEAGGGETYLSSAGGGIGSLKDNGWNLSAGLSWRKSEELKSTSRDFARTGLIPDLGYNRLNATTFPSNYTQSATKVAGNPSAPNCQPPLSLPAGGGNCGFDNAPVVPLLPKLEQWSGLITGSVALGAQVASVEYVRSHSDLISDIAPPTGVGLSMTANNPFFPGLGITPGAPGLNPALPISVSWRVTDVGRSTSEPENTTDRIRGTLEGTLLDWDYELSALRSTSTVTLSLLDGYANTQKLRDGLVGANGAPFLNPFGPQTTAGLQFLLNNEVRGEVQRAEGDLTIVGAQISGNIGTLPGGPLQLAVAAEYRKESSNFRNNLALSRLPQNSGFDLAQDASGSRHSTSLATETSIPVLKNLEISLSARFDDYSDFGNTVNPKVSFRFQPIQLLTLRGSFSTGFRAPALYDVFAPNSLSSARVRSNDPLLCPGGVPNRAAGAVPTRDCNTQFNLRGGGNLNLKAEKSDSFSVGFLLQPASAVSLGVDYWNYHLKQSISSLAESAIYGDPIKYSDLYVRCSSVPAAQRAAIGTCNIPGGDPIAYIIDITSNLGDTKTSGVDISSSWSSDATRLGRFNVSYRGTYVTQYEYQREANGAFFSRDGVFLDGIPVIRYSHFVSLGWERRVWNAQIDNRFKSGYRDCNAGCAIKPQFFRSVSAYSLWDFSLRYSGIEHVTLTAGVTNVLNSDPPVTNRTAGIGNGYDERFADPLGRVYSVTATYKL